MKGILLPSAQKRRQEMTLFHTYIFIETTFEKLHFFSTHYGQGLTLLKDG